MVLVHPKYGQMRMIDQWEDGMCRKWGSFASIRTGIYANLPFDEVQVCIQK